MYECMKTLIKYKFYKTVEEVKARLDTFHTMDLKRLTDDEYEKLIEMVDDTYTN